MHRIILGVYLVVGGLNVSARFFDLQDLHLYTKPLLMPLLIYYLYRYADGNITLPRMLLAGALLFSWIGDLLLMGTGDLYFLGGLGAFLIAHVFYSITFYKSVRSKPKFNILYLIPLGVFGFFILRAVIPGAGDMAVGVIIYSAGILIMAFMASIRGRVTSISSYYLVVIGAYLFVISDSLIALERFHTPLYQGGVFIMTTYISAQLLIVRGVLIHKN